MKSPPADPLRSLRYLDAMGIQVWRLRRGLDATAGERPAAGEPLPPPGEPEPLPESGLQDAGARAIDDAAGEAGRPVPFRQDPAAMDWPALEQAVRSCRACGLCETRTQAVFGVGNQDAELMIIGEAPGADEDRQGEPFVGRAGQLLTAMLRAIGLAREAVYIANVVKCRPPGNRNPTPEEAAACRGYLQRQIDLVAPRLILSVGAVSAHNLLGTDDPVGRLRRRVHRYDPGVVPLLVTYHPAYLLRRPAEKAKVWDDLQQARRLLG